MKKLNIILTLILIALILSTAIFAVNNAIEVNKTLDNLNTKLADIDMSVTPHSAEEISKSEEDIEDTSSEEYVYIDPLTITDFSDEGLAIIVSNKDYPREEIEIIARNNGYEDYTDLCNHLIKQGLLVVIPEYIHPEYGLMHSNIVTPDTVAYHLAVEAGAIKEVQ
jgi:hypothetical protein